MKRFSFTNGSLVHRIACLAILAVLACAVLLGSIATWLATRSLERQAEDTLKIVGATSAVRIGDWIAANQRLIASTVPAAMASPAALQAAQAHPAASGGEAAGDAQLQRALQQTLAAGDYRIAFMAFERDARYVRAPEGPMPAGYNPTERAWYKQAVAAGKPTIPTPYKDVQLNEMNVTFEQPVMRGAALLGVIGAIKPLTDVVKIIAAVKPTAHSYAFVTNEAGLLLIHPDASFVLRPAADVMPWYPRGATASAGAVLAGVDRGRAVWVRTIAVPNSDWRLAVVLDKADALAGLHTLIISMLLAVFLVTLIAALAIVGLLRRSLAQLRRMRDAMISVASGRGDLTTRFEVQGRDEVSEIAHAFNQFCEALRRIVAQVHSASAEVKLAAQEIAIGNQDLSSRTEIQAHTVQTCAGSILRITRASTSNAEHAQQANHIAQVTATLAQQGGGKVADVVATMKEITASSKRIGEIIGVIDSIAFQTNILALNAAVEAARAGEQGRGFAVVAGEVRVLARRSAEAARDIRVLIKQSAGNVETGALRVDDAGRVISKVVESVQSVSQLMAQIVGATGQQSDGIGHVNDAVAQIDLMTQQNAALVEQASAAAESLRDQSARLMDAVGRFRT